MFAVSVFYGQILNLAYALFKNSQSETEINFICCDGNEGKIWRQVFLRF
jgi:hypothetical protein